MIEASHISARNASRIVRLGYRYHSYAMAHGKESRLQEPAEDINEIVWANISRILGPRSPERYCKGEPGQGPLRYVSGKKKGKRVGIVYLT